MGTITIWYDGVSEEVEEERVKLYGPFPPKEKEQENEDG